MKEIIHKIYHLQVLSLSLSNLDIKPVLPDLLLTFH